MTTKEAQARERDLYHGAARRDDPFSMFVDGLSCEHDWQAGWDTHGFRCQACGAKCMKDGEGRIVSYARPAPGMQAPAHLHEQEGAREHAG